MKSLYEVLIKQNLKADKPVTNKEIKTREKFLVKLFNCLLNQRYTEKKYGPYEKFDKGTIYLDDEHRSLTVYYKDNISVSVTSRVPKASIKNGIHLYLVKHEEIDNKIYPSKYFELYISDKGKKSWDYYPAENEDNIPVFNDVIEFINNDSLIYKCIDDYIKDYKTFSYKHVKIQDLL